MHVSCVMMIGFFVSSVHLFEWRTVVLTLREELINGVWSCGREVVYGELCNIRLRRAWERRQRDILQPWAPSIQPYTNRSGNREPPHNCHLFPMSPG